ncbi:MAG: DUF2961 domain-containing protein [Armatimonadetes bacterium]|nr:DUF2961 domain-containing protein [Armatimonadota bacterium]
MLLALAGLAALSSAPVTLKSLVRDAWDLDTLCDYPAPAYVTRQASSYDRTSVRPGNDTWFANQDWGNFLGRESTNGRKEHVMADLKGPGCLVRYWSPNPAGITRVYIDGSTTPVIEAKSTDLLSGKVAPFVAPIGQFTSQGWSLYFPIPYQRGCKVTVDDSDKDAAARMYYHVQYRTYGDAVRLEPFSLEAAEREAAVYVKGLAAPTPEGRNFSWEGNLGPKESATVRLGNGPAVVRCLEFRMKPTAGADWNDPSATQNVLRSLRVVVVADGETCVDAPLGDLCGSSIGLAALDTPPVKVDASGTLSLRFPMPYKSGATVTVTNQGRATIRLAELAQTRPRPWTERSMHFHAQWLCSQINTRPLRDLPFLETSGTGVFVGCSIGISNPVPDWWGEGDEKMYIDHEAFPSTFGTGTEDYFGYGWSSPALFNHPFHYQSRCDGPGTKGHSNIGRWQILERLPFNSAFRFDMELWHWKECDMSYARTTYWYAKPGGSPARSDAGVHLPPFVPGPAKVKGALEGEELGYVASGGTNEIQGFDDLSGGKQLWWRDAKVGDRLTFHVPVLQKGRYKVLGRFCHAKDYGVHTITFGGIKKTIDFYDELGWSTIELGVTDLPAGTNDLVVTVNTPNTKAEPRNMFGLDYVLLVRED